MRYKHSKEDLEKVVLDCKTIADVCRKLGIVAVGGNYKTLKDKLKSFNIDTSHFRGKGWNYGENHISFNKKVLLKDILVENSSYKSTSKLRIKLIKEGVKEHKCEKCLNSEWLGKEIPLELNHINGNNNDNRIENLEIICPNCHAQTDNYRGRNIKSFKNK